MNKVARGRYSLAARLTLGLVLVAVLVIPAVGSILYWALARQLEAAEVKEVQGMVEVVRHVLDKAQGPEDLAGLRQHLDDMLIGHERLRIWVISAEGTLLYGGPSLPKTQIVDGILTVWREDGVPLRGHSVTLDVGSLVPRANLLAGYDSRERYRLLADYRQVTLTVSAIGLLFTVALSVAVNRRGLRPIVRLSQEAAALTPDNLSMRLDSQGIAYELGALVDAFNRALGRVEAAYHQLDAFNADVAHELRTPLASAVIGIEVALARPRSSEELTQSLRETLEGLTSMSSMVNDMLFLARADRDAPLDGAEEIELARHSQIAAAGLSGTLSERDQALVVTGSAWASANPALVQRAVANLVANAIRFAPVGSIIEVDVDQRGPWVYLTVRNHGETIAASLLPRMFERLVRGDAARSGESHHGLGLAIVHAVARLHGGATFARSADGVTEVGFSLPAVKYD